MTKLAIEAAKYTILPKTFLSPEITHNFWCLKDLDSNRLLAAFHGVATSRRTGERVPVGYSDEHSIRFCHCVYDAEFAKEHGLVIDNFALSVDGIYPVYQGEDCLMKMKWLNAAESAKIINTLRYKLSGTRFYRHHN